MNTKASFLVFSSATNKVIFAALLSLCLSTAGFAQQLRNEVSSVDIVLKIQSSNGNNGLAVAFNPKHNVYYSIYAGNESFPLEVHDMKGESVFAKEAGYDARGMWYNPGCNCLEGTRFDNQGSVSISLSNAGYPKELTSSDVNYNLPGQGVTVSNGKYVYALTDMGDILKFKKGKTKAKKMSILSSYRDNLELNYNAIMYTGIKGAEIGLVNYGKSTLVLFSEKNGSFVKEIKIGMSEYSMPENFRVSFANERLFIYDSESRTWSGYKVTQ